MRNRASLVAALALIWHVAAVALVSTALSCGPASGATMNHAGMPGHEGTAGHAGMSGHEGMPDCPMQRQTAPVCLKHGSEHGTHDCDCPTIGCAQSDAGFMALFGAVGIVSAPSEMPAPADLSDPTLNFSSSTRSLAIDPLSPPPRS